jgi:hypothetical protein
MKWSVIDCFIGPNCWCGIILAPDRTECNYYGDITKENCSVIVDALNGETRDHSETFAKFPLPWHVCDDSFIVSHRGVDENGHFVGDIKDCVSLFDGVKQDYICLFVEAVNCNRCEARKLDGWEHATIPS